MKTALDSGSDQIGSRRGALRHSQRDHLKEPRFRAGEIAGEKRSDPREVLPAAVVAVPWLDTAGRTAGRDRDEHSRADRVLEGRHDRWWDIAAPERDQRQATEPVVDEHADEPIAHPRIDLQQLDARLEPADAQPGVGLVIAPARTGERRTTKDDGAGINDADRTEFGCGKRP